MPDEVVIRFEVHSNVDRLSAHAIHDAMKDMLGGVLEKGEDFLRLSVPVGETGALIRHVGHHGPIDEGIRIRGDVGIPPIEEARKVLMSAGGNIAGGRGDKVLGNVATGDPANYPVFVDRGTGIFGSGELIRAHEPLHFMRWEEGGQEIFAKSVIGQPGRFFMARTFAYMVATLKGEAEIFKAKIKAM